jgi:putative CocE/NonD family hydrolase
MRRFTSAAATILFVLVGVSAAHQTEAQPAKAEVDVIWAFKIPMRDGVRLNATLYKPHGQKEPLPVVFTLTPYISDRYQDRAMYFAQNGYVYALVDVRGRGNSGGAFNPFAQEGRDGYDAVEFLAKQPWSNGKIAMWGGSYAGYDQWATLRERPPHLTTIVPAASVGPGIDFPFFNGVWYPYDIMWLTYVSGVTPNDQLFANQEFWQAKFREINDGRAAFRELDRLVGNTSTVWQTWMQHPTLDSFWTSMRPNEQQYRDMKVPVLTITGYFDGDQRGALYYYRQHQQYSPASAQHFLIFGPWSHGGTRSPSAELGGLKFNQSSKLDLNELHKAWYDWTMKGGSKPEFFKDRVAYFVMGSDLKKEMWKYASSLEAISEGRRTFYLTSDGSANDVFHSGVLLEKAPQPDSPTDHFVYDPLVTHADDESDEQQGFLEQSTAMELYNEGVIYHSAKFSEETEIAGQLKLTLWLSADVPDTDLSVRVTEIRPDGRSIFLADDMMRASYRDYRDVPSQGKLLKPGEPAKIEFLSFPWFARRLAKGSRLRLIIRAVNTPSWEKNYNSGTPVEDELAKNARTAHVTLLHDAAHPSALELPIGH